MRVSPYLFENRTNHIPIRLRNLKAIIENNNNNTGNVTTQIRGRLQKHDVLLLGRIVGRVKK